MPLVARSEVFMGIFCPVEKCRIVSFCRRAEVSGLEAISLVRISLFRVSTRFSMARCLDNCLPRSEGGSSARISSGCPSTVGRCFGCLSIVLGRWPGFGSPFDVLCGGKLSLVFGLRLPSVGCNLWLLSAWGISKGCWVGSWPSFVFALRLWTASRPLRKAN